MPKEKSRRFSPNSSENATAAYLDLDYLILADSLQATFRIDEQPAFSRRLLVSKGSEGAGLWRGNEAIPLIKQMFGAVRLFARVEVPRANDADMTFDISRLENEITPLRKACHW